MAELRVLEVLGSSAGGVARHVAQIVGAAQDRGFQVVVAGPDRLRAQLVAGSGSPFQPVEIADRPGPADLRTLGRLRTLAGGADVVHAHGLRAGVLALVAARLAPGRPPVVVTLHNLPVGGRAIAAVAGALEAVVAHGAHTVLGVSGDLVDRARKRGALRVARALVPAPARRGTIADPDAVRSALGVGVDQHLLVTVARLAPQKGLDLLCDAAALLHAKALPVLWVVAGDGPLLGDVQARIVRDELPVRMLGRREDVADLMGAADVVVSSARWEGQPLGVQEALVLGAAVVATDVGGTREVTGDAAVLVDPDARSLAAAVESLLRDGASREALRAAARDRARQLPTLEDMMNQLITVWNEAVGR